jgi:hypothetical protein
MKIKTAESIIGSLSKPAKMPGFAFGINPAHCKQGSKLSKVAGSVCAGCYAKKGNYARYPETMRKSWEKREAGIHDLQWVQAMVTLIGKRSSDYFRWHDAGDLQGMEHLKKIVAIARALPATRFWMPTKEINLVRDYTRKYGEFPKNLVVRVSGFMVDGPASKGFRNTSRVTTDAEQATCKAYLNDGKCGDCRDCWNANVQQVVYLQH